MSSITPAANRFALLAERAFDGLIMRGRTAIIVEAGRIAAIGAPEAVGADQLPLTRLPAGALAAPGFVDLQVNGGGGALVNADPSLSTIRRIADTHRRFGTTSLLPTLISDDPERMEALLAIADQALAIPGVIGFHLEGPHINAARRGIHPERAIRLLGVADHERLAGFGRSGRSLVTLAPECVGKGDINRLAKAGLTVSAGHSAATAQEIGAAIAEGLGGVTHLFNAMSQITPREAGLVGAALDDARLCAGIIADGIHVAPANLRLAFRLLGADRLMLVSDAMPSVGAAGGGFDLAGQRIVLENGRLTGPDGTLAGAHLTLDQAVRYATRLMGARLSEALAMASLTPARFLGLDGEIGRLAPGRRADLVVLDEGLEVIDTLIGGRSLSAPSEMPAGD